MLVASCGEQHKSQSLADDFMDAYLVAPDRVEDVEYSKIDSTKLISDSAVNAMRSQLKASKLFKPEVEYSSGKVEGKLLRLRVNYKIDGSAKSTTFYLDKDLNGVVAVKND